MLLQDITVNTGTVSTRYNSKYSECFFKILQKIQGMFLQDITLNTGNVTTRYNIKYRECFYKK